MYHASRCHTSRRIWLHLLCTLPLGSWKQQQYPPAAEAACFSQLLCGLCAPGPAPPLMGFAGLETRGRKLKQVHSHGCLVEGDNHPPCPAGSSLAAAAQDAVGRLSCKGRLLAHHKLFPHQSPNILFCKAVFCSAPDFPATRGYCIPRTGFALAIVDFMRFLSARLSISLTAALSSTVATPAPHLQRTISLLRFFFPLSLVKTSNSVGPGIDPPGMLLVTSHCWTLHCWSQPFRDSSL